MGDMLFLAAVVLGAVLFMAWIVTGVENDLGQSWIRAAANRGLDDALFEHGLFVEEAIGYDPEPAPSESRFGLGFSRDDAARYVADARFVSRALKALEKGRWDPAVAVAYVRRHAVDRQAKFPRFKVGGGAGL